MTTTIIKGRGKGGSNQTRTPVEAPDSIQSIARAKVLIALGEGSSLVGLMVKTFSRRLIIVHTYSERRRKLQLQQCEI
jgi:hypothetical protein